MRRGLMALVMVSFLCSGCVYMIIGGAAALGGYVISPDTVEGIVEYSEEDLWRASKDVLSLMGRIQESSKRDGYLMSLVAGGKVQIYISSFDAKSAKFRVKARRSFFPKITLAQEVYMKVIQTLSN